MWNSRQAFDAVAWQIADGVEPAAGRLSPLAAETLYYATRELVRNAAKYGRPAPAGRAGDFRLTLAVGIAGESAAPHH